MRRMDTSGLYRAMENRMLHDFAQSLSIGNKAKRIRNRLFKDANKLPPDDVDDALLTPHQAPGSPRHRQRPRPVRLLPPDRTTLRRALGRTRRQRSSQRVPHPRQAYDLVVRHLTRDQYDDATIRPVLDAADRLITQVEAPEPYMRPQSDVHAAIEYLADQLDAVTLTVD